MIARNHQRRSIYSLSAPSSLSLSLFLSHSPSPSLDAIEMSLCARIAWSITDSLLDEQSFSVSSFARVKRGERTDLTTLSNQHRSRRTSQTRRPVRRASIHDPEPLASFTRGTEGHTSSSSSSSFSSSSFSSSSSSSSPRGSQPRPRITPRCSFARSPRSNGPMDRIVEQPRANLARCSAAVHCLIGRATTRERWLRASPYSRASINNHDPR